MAERGASARHHPAVANALLQDGVLDSAVANAAAGGTSAARDAAGGAVMDLPLAAAGDLVTAAVVAAAARGGGASGTAADELGAASFPVAVPASDEAVAVGAEESGVPQIPGVGGADAAAAVAAAAAAASVAPAATGAAGDAAGAASAQQGETLTEIPLELRCCRRCCLIRVLSQDKGKRFRAEMMLKPKRERKRFFLESMRDASLNAHEESKIRSGGGAGAPSSTGAVADGGVSKTMALDASPSGAGGDVPGTGSGSGAGVGAVTSANGVAVRRRQKFDYEFYGEPLYRRLRAFFAESGGSTDLPMHGLFGRKGPHANKSLKPFLLDEFKIFIEAQKQKEGVPRLARNPDGSDVADATVDHWELPSSWSRRGLYKEYGRHLVERNVVPEGGHIPSFYTFRQWWDAHAPDIKIATASDRDKWDAATVKDETTEAAVLMHAARATRAGIAPQ